MSTYYFLVCEKHKEYCDGASRTAGGVCHLADSKITLPRFIYTHRNCKLVILSEHVVLEDAYQKEYAGWTEGNYNELRKRKC